MVDWTEIIFEGARNFWIGFMDFIPSLILALIIFIIGWLIAAFIGRIVQEILKRLQLDKLFKIRKWNEALEKAEFSGGPSEFIGGLIKWILVIVTLSISVEILNLAQFSNFLSDKVINIWLPNILAAVLIFVATVIIAGFVEKLVKASLHGAKVNHGKYVATIVVWAIWIFGIFAILTQLGIAEDLVGTISRGIIYGSAAAFALAFGLGGKESASDFLKGLRNKLR